MIGGAIFMKRKYLTVSIFFLSLFLTLLSCHDAKTSTHPVASEASRAYFSNGSTLDYKTLAQFDGQNGNPAYIAVDGLIYDVTYSTQWSKLLAKGLLPGQDLSRNFKLLNKEEQNILLKIPVIGLYEASLDF